MVPWGYGFLKGSMNFEVGHIPLNGSDRDNYLDLQAYSMKHLDIHIRGHLLDGHFSMIVFEKT